MDSNLTNQPRDMIFVAVAGLRDVMLKHIRKSSADQYSMRMIVSVHSPHLQRPLKAIIITAMPSFAHNDSDDSSSSSYNE